jgi:hypothetical protein
MSGEEYITQALLNVCVKCCDECVGEGHGILYCMDICGCNCDELFDDVDCDPDIEYCEEDWEDEGGDYEW